MNPTATVPKVESLKQEEARAHKATSSKEHEQQHLSASSPDVSRRNTRLLDASIRSQEIMDTEASKPQRISQAALSLVSVFFFFRKVPIRRMTRCVHVITFEGGWKKGRITRSFEVTLRWQARDCESLGPLRLRLEGRIASREGKSSRR